MIPAIFFGIFAGLTVFSALALTKQTNIINASFIFLVTLLGLAAVYILLDADFIAVTQILIYVGGVLILILFGALITRKKENKNLISRVTFVKRTRIAVIIIFMFLSYAFWNEKHLFSNETINKSSVHEIGFGLMKDYLLPFELTGVVLLIILVAVLALSSSVSSD